MENNLSAPLTEISEKLTTISEDLKKLQKEDRLISTGKTCPYRRAILWTAFVTQVISIVGFNYISVYIDPLTGSLLVLFSYIGISLAGETLVYRILKLKDSNKADVELVRDKYNLTLAEADVYIRKLIDIRVVATIVFLISLFTIYLTRSTMVYMTFLSYLLTTLVSILYVRMRGKIKVPKRFFLFDMPKGDPNAPLMKNKEGFFASDYDNNWHRYDTSVLKRERN